MAAEKLLGALREDGMARLRHAVLERTGVSPFSLRAVLISDRQIIKYACHMVLDGESTEEAAGGGFDMERFLNMKEARGNGI